MLAVVATPIPADAQDRRVRVVNNTSQVMVRLQASNINRTSWEEDILGRNVLLPRQATRANLDDRSGQCLFDLRATFRNGATATRRRINICQISTWTIND
ncbi:MAG: hypothetical protein ACRCUE_11915 [Bosea sp. (in: a-proteobacteria)]